MAPAKGTDTRKKVFKGAEDLADDLKEKIRISNKKIDEYTEMAEETIDKINKKLKTTEKSYT